jgi:hypothetical protein
MRLLGTARGMLNMRHNRPMTATRSEERARMKGRRIWGGEEGVVVKQPANLENGRAEERR